MRRVLFRFWQLVVISGFVALVAVAPAATAEPSVVALNEVNCVGSDWVEVVNRSNAEVSLAGWLLTDDAVDAVPAVDARRMRFGADAVLVPGARLVVKQGAAGFPFDLACGDDTLRLADASDTLVDSLALPVLASSGMTLGRIPDATGDWTVTVPTPGTANALSTGTQSDDPAWLYDPLQMTEIDLDAEPGALAQLADAPDTYVPARITMRNSGTVYGPYLVGLRLKGHGTFRSLTGKAAFKIKFAFSVSGQRFHGLKGLTLNNMVQDPSMIAEAASSLLFAEVGVPSARVGYAYVRLNGADYGLYADVETVDTAMARRWASSTKHIYEADVYALDVSPGRESEFDVGEGSSTDIADLVALFAANAGGASGWWERMQTVADVAELTRAWAAEHYAGHWDGYSVPGPNQPSNYYLHSDSAGHFRLIPSGTDQTWLERPQFGVYGRGVLMRNCVSDDTCRNLYVDTLRQVAANPAIVALPVKVRAIDAAIAPWRARDPRREQSLTEGETEASAKIASMEARPAELAAWLEGPSFVSAEQSVPEAVGGVGASDLTVSGTVTPASSPVGGSHVWRLQVSNTGAAAALGVTLDAQLSPNSVFGFSQVTRGSGCVPAGARLHCLLDFLGAAGDASSTAEIVVGTNVTGAGEVSLTATASFAGSDPTPSDDSLVLRTNAAAAPPVQAAPPVVVRPVLGTPERTPATPVSGKRFTFSLPVTRSDTHAPLLRGTMACDPSVAGKTIRHTESFKAGKAKLSFVVPKTAKGKRLRIKVTITSSGRTAGRTYTYPIR